MKSDVEKDNDLGFEGPAVAVDKQSDCQAQVPPTAPNDQIEKPQCQSYPLPTLVDVQNEFDCSKIGKDPMAHCLTDAIPMPSGPMPMPVNSHMAHLLMPTQLLG